jgi:hypothetical protein
LNQQTSVPRTRIRSRAPALWATAVALALINIGAAATIVSIIGARGFAPLWLGLVLVLCGVAAAVGAVLLWRQYLADMRER